MKSNIKGKSKEGKAKELCAMLIKRAIKNLNEDEEDVVTDYLENVVGIEVNIDDSFNDLCYKLLNFTMQKEFGNKNVPISAYANQVLSSQEKLKEEESLKYKMKYKTMDYERKRRISEEELKRKDKSLPGCIPDFNEIMSKTLYTLRVDEQVGIDLMEDNTVQYTAQVALNSSLYEKIFENVENPILEIVTSKGNKAYARVGTVHNESRDLILISPLIANFLDIQKQDGGFVKLCIDIPKIKKVDFTYYGTQKNLDEDLEVLTRKLPKIINAFSYLSLGMVLRTFVGEKEILVRVDKLDDENGTPIFVGIIPAGESDIPFDVLADE